MGPAEDDIKQEMMSLNKWWPVRSFHISSLAANERRGWRCMGGSGANFDHIFKI